MFSLAEREETTRSAKSSAPFMLLVVSSFLDTVRTSVLHLEAMQDLAVRAGERIRFTLPLVKLAEHYRIAVEGRKRTAVFKDGLRKQFGISPAGGREGRAFGVVQFIEQRPDAAMIVEALIEGGQPEKFLCVIEAPAANMA